MTSQAADAGGERGVGSSGERGALGSLGALDGQYATGLSRRDIERALADAGQDLGGLKPADLGMLEDFHTLGRLATAQLMELAGVGGADYVLDAGTGIGGTARFLADRYGCRVAGVDLTAEYVETARWLDQLVGLDGRITPHQGDVTDLPFADGSFDVVVSQHVQMNIADKALLYGEARRVLADGGRLALWDVTAGEGALDDADFPLPWADRPELSHLAAPDELRAVIGAAGFEIAHWKDLTDDAAPFMATVLSTEPGPLGLQAFVPDFARKVRNLTRALANGRLRVIQGIAKVSG
ncbi:MAG: class I SAM-dependent methyltransferase [Actinocrinis sp.]